MTGTGVVIAGASVAGLHVAEQLRSRGYTGPVALVDVELSTPYDKPPLSKGFLAGGLELGALALMSEERFAALDVELLQGVGATALLVDGLALSDGTSRQADHVVIATGASARNLPGQPTSGRVLTLRSLDDARRLRSSITPGRHLVVIGAGLIGTEVAWTARGLDAEVTVVDQVSLPLARVVGDQAGARLMAAHQAEGVAFRMETSVAGITDEGDVVAVELASGPTLYADSVLVAVGAVPRSDWLPVELLDERGGVIVDVDGCVRGRPGVYAAGDVCTVGTGVAARRTEHWTAARDQAATVACTILGQPRSVPSMPDYVWTDQAGMKVQILGNPRSGDREVVDAEPDVHGRGAVHLSTVAGVPVGAVIFGAPRAMPRYLRMLAAAAESVDEVPERGVMVE